MGVSLRHKNPSAPQWYGLACQAWLRRIPIMCGEFCFVATEDIPIILERIQRVVYSSSLHV